MFKLKNVNAKATQSYRRKLKELKTWAQVRSPKSIQPALNYTLGWLSPELLGTGFRMMEVSDFEMKAVVPADSTNLDSEGQIHQGLIVNAAMELAKTFINRHLTESFYRITATEIKMGKKLNWNQNVSLSIVSSDAGLDDFFSDLQSSKKAVAQFRIVLTPGESKKTDSLDLKLTCEPTNLLTQEL